MQQMIVIRTSKRGRDFMVMSADLYLNWLVPYFKNHRYVKNLVFNRVKDDAEILVEFDCSCSFEFLRFAIDLNQALLHKGYIDKLNFVS